jgi:hypothetical protein
MQECGSTTGDANNKERVFHWGGFVTAEEQLIDQMCTPGSDLIYEEDGAEQEHGHDMAHCLENRGSFIKQAFRPNPKELDDGFRREP